MNEKNLENLLKILVVNGQDLRRKRLKRDLLSYGQYEIDEATTTDEGLQKILDEQYSLIIASGEQEDVKTFVEKVRINPLSHKTNVLLIGEFDVNAALRLGSAGASYILSKRYSSKELENKIKDLIKSEFGKRELLPEDLLPKEIMRFPEGVDLDDYLSYLIGKGVDELERVESSKVSRDEKQRIRELAANFFEHALSRLPYLPEPGKTKISHLVSRGQVILYAYEIPKETPSEGITEEKEKVATERVYTFYHKDPRIHKIVSTHFCKRFDNKVRFECEYNAIKQDIELNKRIDKLRSIDASDDKERLLKEAGFTQRDLIIYRKIPRESQPQQLEPLIFKKQPFDAVLILKDIFLGPYLSDLDQNIKQGIESGNQEIKDFYHKINFDKLQRLAYRQEFNPYKLLKDDYSQEENFSKNLMENLFRNFPFFKYTPKQQEEQIIKEATLSINKLLRIKDRVMYFDFNNTNFIFDVKDKGISDLEKLSNFAFEHNQTLDNVVDSYFERFDKNKIFRLTHPAEDTRHKFFAPQIDKKEQKRLDYQFLLQKKRFTLLKDYAQIKEDEKAREVLNKIEQIEDIIDIIETGVIDIDNPELGQRIHEQLSEGPKAGEKLFKDFQFDACLIGIYRNWRWVNHITQKYIPRELKEIRKIREEFKSLEELPRDHDKYLELEYHRMKRQQLTEYVYYLIGNSKNCIYYALETILNETPLINGTLKKTEQEFNIEYGNTILTPSSKLSDYYNFFKRIQNLIKKVKTEDALIKLNTIYDIACLHALANLCGKLEKAHIDYKKIFPFEK